MSLPRKSTVNQLKKLRKITKNDIGDKTANCNGKDMPNAVYIKNPADDEISTINEFIPLEENKLYTKFSEFLNEKAKKEEKGDDFENTPTTAQVINREMKTIQNWNNIKTTKNVMPRDLLVAGKQIKIGDIEGLVNRIQDGIVYIETVDGMKEVKLKDAFKKQKS